MNLGFWKLEARSWKLEAGSWKLEVGDWRLEIGKACYVKKEHGFISPLKRRRNPERPIMALQHPASSIQYPVSSIQNATRVNFVF